jgi:hypothetical protein
VTTLVTEQRQGSRLDVTTLVTEQRQGSRLDVTKLVTRLTTEQTGRELLQTVNLLLLTV